MEKISDACAVVLAAGEGTRMKSAHPKVMCEVLFRPMISWVLQSCISAGIERGCAVLGSDADEVSALLPEQFDTVLQPERRGTGHAAGMAREFLRGGGFSHVAVLYGDAPLITGEDLRAGFEQHVREGNQVTITTARLAEPYGFGRILRENGRVAAIVEERDATDAQRAISEVNTGPYWFRADFLLDFFERMTCDNTQGEYYLTDCVACALEQGGRVGAHVVGPEAALGANSRAELQRLNETARRMVLERHMENGVNIPFADGIIIGPEVEIGTDTTILPGVILRGKTRVGADCEIGPGSTLLNAEVGDGCRILSSQLESAIVQAGTRIGPMSNIRPGSRLGAGVKIGNFVEIKNSAIGEQTSVAHLTYVGDSDVGAGCNFGCGVVTVNYDGQGKYRTVVGNDAFIGCNVNLVAPVRVGDRVYAAAGTTITEEVPDDALVIGRARQVVKENWVSERGRYQKKRNPARRE